LQNLTFCWNFNQSVDKVMLPTTLVRTGPGKEASL